MAYLKRRFCLAPGLRAYIVLLLIFSAPVSAEITPFMAWTAADMLPFDSGVSVFQYADFGLGDYPWRFSLPGAVMRVRIDGAPLYGLSPFGPDLDAVPAVFVDSLVYEQPGVISIRTGTHVSDKPETMSDFFQGASRRFRFQGTFKRKLSAQSSLFLGGSSSGIHGSRDTEAAAFRNYFMKYRRMIEKGGELFLTARTLRDRDGLRDSMLAQHMGDRETDMINLTAGVSNLPLTGRTTVSPVVYYQNGISRFRRYGLRKSLDDDGFGFSCDASSRFDDGILALTASSDIRSIDSRLHGKSWQRDDSRLSVSWRNAGDRLQYSVYSGVLHSSRFGTGGSGGGEVNVRMAPSVSLSVRGALGNEFPDAGMEVYSALAFSDSLSVPRLSMYRFRELESGLSGHRGAISWGVFGFRSGGRLPVFNPETALCSTGDDETFSGTRLFLGLESDERYTINVRAYYCHPGDTDRFNPYPTIECVSSGGVVRMFLQDKLKSTFYGSVRVSGWDGPMTPDKTALFIDTGASLAVASLSLFINVQNITGEQVKWLDTYGWPGINTVWGVRWKLDD